MVADVFSKRYSCRKLVFFRSKFQFVRLSAFDVHGNICIKTALENVDFKSQVDLIML